MTGEDLIGQMQQSGMPSSEIAAWAGREQQRMRDAGVPQEVINADFGRPSVDPRAIQAHVRANVEKRVADSPDALTVFGPESRNYDTGPGTALREPGAPREIGRYDWNELLKYGLGESTFSLYMEAKSGKQYERKTLDANASFLERQVYNAGALLGSIPFYIAGGAMGAPGGPAGIGAGAFGVDAAVRAAYRYEGQRGAIKSAAEFADAFVHITAETLKGFTIGGLTVGGGLAAKYALPTAATAIGRVGVYAGMTAAEIATMATVSAGLEGQLPKLTDFEDLGGLILGLHGVRYVARKTPSAVKAVADKAWTIYEKTGAKPEDVLHAAEQDVTVTQDLVAKGKDIPRAYKHAYDAGNPPAEVPVADVRYEGFQQGFEKTPGFHLWTTTKAFGEFPAGTTLSSATIEKAGFALPEVPEALLKHPEDMLISEVAAAKSGTMVPEAHQELKDMADFARTRAIAAEPGKRASVEEELIPGKRDTSYESSYPDWYASLATDQGMPRKAILDSLDMIVEGKDGATSGTGPRPETVAKVKEALLRSKEMQGFLDAKGGSAVPVQRASSPAFRDSKEPAFEWPNISDVLGDERGSAPLGKEPTPLEKAEQAVLARMTHRTNRFKLPSLEQLYTRYVDKYNPILLAVQERYGKQGARQLPADQNPYILQRLTAGDHGRGIHFLNFGTYDARTYEKTGPAYIESLSLVKDHANEFRAYLIAKRSIEVKDVKGLVTGVPLDEARFIVKERSKPGELNDAIHKAAALRTQYKDEGLIKGMLVSSGLVDAKGAEFVISMNRAHIPMYRFFDDLQGSVQAKGQTLRNPLKTMVGSNREFYDPIESDIRDTFIYLKLAEDNMVRQAYVALGPPFAVEQQMKVAPIRLTDPELDRFVVENQLEGDATAFTIFRDAKRPAAPDEMVVYYSGVRKVFNVHPDVAAAFSHESMASGWLYEIFKAPASSLRAGVVLNPEYVIRNAVKDAVGAFVTEGSNPLKTALGLKSVVTKDLGFQNWLKGGGANATIQSIDRDYVQAELYKLDAQTQIMQRSWNVATRPIDLLRIMSELSENMTRRGSTFRLTEGGKYEDQLAEAQTKASILALSFKSRELTTDFSRHGSSESFYKYTKSVGFMGPWIQSLDRIARAFYYDPVVGWTFRGETPPKAADTGPVPRALAKVPITKGTTLADTVGPLSRSLVAITLPSLLLWWANKDDKRIADLPPYERDMFDHVAVGDHIARIPKSYELGVVFGTLPQRLMDAFFKDNPDAMKDFDKMMVNAFISNVIPTALVPPIEQYANKSLYTGNPVIPYALERELPEYQYNEYTTETAKQIGALMGAFPGMTKYALKDQGEFMPGVARALTSPILLEHYLRSWTGGLGMYVEQLVDLPLRRQGIIPNPVKPEKYWTEGPFIKAFFVRYPSMNAAPIRDFYDTYYEKERSWNSYKRAEEAGDFEKMKKVLAFDPSGATLHLLDIRKTLTSFSHIMHKIEADPQKTPSDKRQLIDTFIMRSLEVARYGNTLFQQADKNMEGFGKPN